MPKPQYKAAEGLTQSTGLPPGNYEILSNVYKNIKSDFDEVKIVDGVEVKYKPVTLNHVFTLAVLNEAGDKVRGADEIEFKLGFGKQSLQSFHPGQADAADDSDPTDQGVEPDAEGNTIYCVGEDEFNASTAAWVFYESLVKQGFPKTKLGNFWTDDFNGLKLTVEQVGAVEINKMLGLRLNTRPLPLRKNAPEGTVAEPAKYRIATKWLNAKEAIGKKPSAKAAAAAADEPADDATPKSVEELALDCIRGLAETKAGVEYANLLKLRGVAQQYWLTNAKSKGFPPGAKMAEAMKLITDEKWIAKAAKKVDAAFSDGTFTFAEAVEE